LRSGNYQYKFQGKKHRLLRGQIFCGVERSNGRKEGRKEEVRDKENCGVFKT
jgi:hypothetical protein